MELAPLPGVLVSSAHGAPAAGRDVDHADRWSYYTRASDELADGPHDNVLGHQRRSAQHVTHEDRPPWGSTTQLRRRLRLPP
ncbi:MAG: hypothetical protein IR158_11810 [Cellulomonas sp.]|uniref:hypothetical protein n=1 Tax=Cellulomonas sp. TaxID=40001 RepID=UPI0019E77321|nr:hypothetical protein [Cellulomonas sp.]MBF0688434.1 hypothetical protein [Cellulomonas sp.]